jgi:hypothetical protein
MDQGAAGVEAGSDLQGRLMISELIGVPASACWVRAHNRDPSLAKTSFCLDSSCGRYIVAE